MSDYEAKLEAEVNFNADMSRALKPSNTKGEADELATIRKAVERLRSYVNNFDCDYYEERCTPGDSEACLTCKHLDIADGALAALDRLSARRTSAETATDARELATRIAYKHATNEMGVEEITTEIERFAQARAALGKE